MPDRMNAWQVFDQTWRSAISAFWRLPTLVLGSWLSYALISSYGLRIFPAGYPPGLIHRFLNDAFYDSLHAVFFAPLVIAIITLVVRRSVAYVKLWSGATIFVALLLAVREIFNLLLLMPIRATFQVRATLGYELYERTHSVLAFVLMQEVPAYLWYLVCSLIWVRVILLFPITALSNTSLKAAITRAWRDMRGHYRFALIASVLAILPYFVLEDFIYSRIYRPLIDQTAAITITEGLSPLHWKGLLIRSAVVMGRYMIYAALAGWLYSAIEARRVTAPSL